MLWEGKKKKKRGRRARRREGFYRRGVEERKSEITVNLQDSNGEMQIQRSSMAFSGCLPGVFTRQAPLSHHPGLGWTRIHACLVDSLTLIAGPGLHFTRYPRQCETH